VKTAVAASLVVLTATVAPAQVPTREECEAAHPASLGRAGKDVPWVTTADGVARAMLSMAQVGPGDVVLDLGAGDGRIAIAAARPPFGAKAVGIEYDAELAKRAACLVRAEGLSDAVRIVEGDIFKEDFGAASVVTMYLLPHLNLCVRHRLLALEPGTRVVSHQYGMEDWRPEQSVTVLGRNIHRWTVPARVDGVWDFRDSHGETFAVEFRQAFGALAGDVVRGARRTPLTGTVQGRQVRFTFAEGGANTQVSGTAHGGEIAATVLAGTAASTASGRLRGEPVAAAWAQMPPECVKYYRR
jgi:SAM-dependent methyltransferase